MNTRFDPTQARLLSFTVLGTLINVRSGAYPTFETILDRASASSVDVEDDFGQRRAGCVDLGLRFPDVTGNALSCTVECAAEHLQPIGIVVSKEAVHFRHGGS